MNTANELKNSEESFNRRLHYAEERISNWEDRSFEIRQLEQQKEKKMRKKAYENCGISLTEIIYKLLEFPEGEKSDKGMGSLFKEMMIENFSNVGRELGIQDHEASRSLQNSNSK